MNKFKKIVIVVASLTIAAMFFIALLFETVEVGKIGVKLNKWGGLVEADYAPGLHFSVSGIHEWKFLNRTTHFLHFSRHKEDGDPLIIRTKDNNEIYVDVSIPYRIVKGEGHLLIKGGLEKNYKDRMELITKSLLRSELAKLSPRNIIQSDFRMKVAEKALPLLNEKLKPNHLQAEEILIRSFSFKNKKVERTIQEKQYLRQETLLKTAQVLENDAKLSTNALETEIVNAEKKATEDANKKIQKLRSEYQIKIAQIERERNTYDKKIRAEGDARREILIAEGKLAQAEAEALKIKLEANILKSKGGKLFIAKQAAENLNIGRLKLNSNQKNPLNVISLKNLLKLVQP